MTKQELFSILNNPENLLEINIKSIKDLAGKYPYCSVFQMLLVKKMQVEQDADFQKQLNLTATISPDRKSLFNYLKSPLKNYPPKENTLLQVEADMTEPNEKIEAESVHSTIAEEEIEIETTNENPVIDKQDNSDGSNDSDTTKYDTLLENSVAAGAVIASSTALTTDITAKEESTETLENQEIVEESEALKTDTLDSVEESEIIQETEKLILETEALVEEGQDNQILKDTKVEEEIVNNFDDQAVKEDAVEKSIADGVVDQEEQLIEAQAIAVELELPEDGSTEDELLEAIEIDSIDVASENRVKEEIQEIVFEEGQAEYSSESDEKDSPGLEIEHSVLDLTASMKDIKTDSTETIGSIHEIMFLSEIEIPYEESDTAIKDEEEEDSLSFSDWLNNGKPVQAPQSTDNEEETPPMIKVRKRKKKMKKNDAKSKKTKEKKSKKKLEVKDKAKVSKKNKKKAKHKKKEKKKKRNNKIKVIAKISVSKNEDIVAENLAKILVAQGKIKEAKSMYKKLILKFPEKSTLFAQKLKDIKQK